MKELDFMANIRKKKDSYLVRVSCGYDIDGKQIMHSITWKPSPNMTPKQIEKELQKQAFEFEQKCVNGLVSNNPHLTFAEFIPQYLSIKKDSLSPTTYAQYDRILNSIIVKELDT